MKLNQPLFVALDVDSKAQALSLVESLSGLGCGFKVGPRLLLGEGQEFTQSIARCGPLFIDCKFYDIPNTMEQSVRAAFQLGASYVTIHAGCGPVALSRMVELESELKSIRPFQILAVTVLTSMSESTRPAHWSNEPLEAHVNALVDESLGAGITGFVCSAHEALMVSQKKVGLTVVTPGIRLEEDSKGDQKRVATPEYAIQQGATSVVMGRSIVLANNPRDVVSSVIERMSLK